MDRAAGAAVDADGSTRVEGAFGTLELVASPDDAVAGIGADNDLDAGVVVGVVVGVVAEGVVVEFPDCTVGIVVATTLDAGDDVGGFSGFGGTEALADTFGVGVDVGAEAVTFDWVTGFAARSGAGCAEALGTGVECAGRGVGGVGDDATGWVARSEAGVGEGLGTGVGAAGQGAGSVGAAASGAADAISGD